MGKDILGVTLLLLPGFISLAFFEFINGRGSKTKTEIERIIDGLLFNVPTFLISWGLLLLSNLLFIRLGWTRRWNLVTVDNLLLKFNSIKFVLFYVVVCVISGLTVGNLTALLLKKDGTVTRAMNLFRGVHKRSDIITYDVWDDTFGTREEQVVEVKIEGETIKGFLKDFSFAASGDREITLEHLDTVQKWDDYLQKIKKVYVHIPSGTVVKIYDTSEMIEVINDLTGNEQPENNET